MFSPKNTGILVSQIAECKRHDSTYGTDIHAASIDAQTLREFSFPQMLEYWWMASNETRRNGSGDVAIEEMLQDPGSVILFVGYPRWLLYFAAACCILFMLIGIPGNIITVIALFRTKKVRN